LASLAGSKEIIMNADFVAHIKAGYERTANKAQFKEVKEIVGPWPVKLKGFKNHVSIFKLMKL